MKFVVLENKNLEAGYDLIVSGGSLTLKYKDKELKCVDLPPKFFYEKSEESLSIVAENYKLNFQKVFARKIAGTYRSIIKNAIQGLAKKHTKKVLVSGVGYRVTASSDPKILKISAGKTHQFTVVVPEGVEYTIGKDGTEITMASEDKCAVGLLGQKLTNCVKLNPYKGTGLYYSDQTIIKKAINKKN